MSEPNHAVHVWETQEIVLSAERQYENPYADVDVWIRLQGPGFDKRVRGFWDGGQTYRVRFVATAVGQWTWTSDSNQADAGLKGKTGGLTAAQWPESAKAENPTRRGFLRHMPNHRAFQYADGTPFFALGDTLWVLPTYRYPWQPELQGIGPGKTGFQDTIQLRKAQGFNVVALLACLPAWKDDGLEDRLAMPDGTVLRSPWPNFGIDMHNENGERAFLFPGRVAGFEEIFPDFERINPAYFQTLDRKIDYLNEQGIIPFIEPARRDIAQAILKHHRWPETYARLVHYVWSRYHAHNAMLSPIHYDARAGSVTPAEYNQAANQIVDEGANPFDLPVSANPMESARQSFGNVDEARWLTFDMAGNDRLRAHRTFEEHVTRDFNRTPPLPAINGEPYYAGWATLQSGWEIPYGSKTDDRHCRCAMYGNVLSGALAGHFYGASGAWGGWHAPQAEPKAWDALQWDSAGQMQHLRTFIAADGAPYWDLKPMKDLLDPCKSQPNPDAFEGWAYCARTDDKALFMLYFEKACRRPVLSGALSDRAYRARWFDPRKGQWSPAGRLTADSVGHIDLPVFPEGQQISRDDWAMRLEVLGQDAGDRSAGGQCC